MAAGERSSMRPGRSESGVSWTRTTTDVFGSSTSDTTRVVPMRMRGLSEGLLGVPQSDASCGHCIGVHFFAIRGQLPGKAIRLSLDGLAIHCRNACIVRFALVSADVPAGHFPFCVAFTFSTVSVPAPTRRVPCRLPFTTIQFARLTGENRYGGGEPPPVRPGMATPPPPREPVTTMSSWVPLRVPPVDRIVPNISVEVHAVPVPDRVGLHEPAKRRRVDARLVVIQACFGEPRLAGIPETGSR